MKLNYFISLGRWSQNKYFNIILEEVSLGMFVFKCLALVPISFEINDSFEVILAEGLMRESCVKLFCN